MPTLADRLVLWQKNHRRAIPVAGIGALAYTLSINVFRDYQFSIQQLLPRFLLVFALLVYAPAALKRQPGRASAPRSGAKAGSGPPSSTARAKASPQPNLRRLLPFALFGCLASFFIVAMRTVLTPEGSPHPWQGWLWAPFLLFAATYTLCCCGASHLLERIDLRPGDGVTEGKAASPGKHHALALLFGPRAGAKTLLVITLALVVLWLPYFLSFGPLRISADSYVVIGQGLGLNTLDDSHPILYTLLSGAFLRLGQALGSITLGAYLFGFLQMGLLAAALAYSLCWLLRRGCPPLLCLLAFLFYACTPVFAVNGFTMWKDIPFNALLLLLCLQLHSIAASRGAWLHSGKNTAALVAVCTGTCFMRGNGFLIAAAMAALILLMFRKEWRRILVVFVPMLLLISLIRGPLYSALDIQRLGSVESAAIPLQQVSRVISQGGQLTAEQQEVIERFVPLETIRQNYQSISPDYIKKHESFDTAAFEENFGDFMGVWAQLLASHPGEYANAWLLQTLGYWKFDFPGRTIYIDDEYNGAYGIEYKDMVRKVTGYDFRTFAAARQDFLPLGLMAHMVLFAAAHLVATRRSRMVLCLAPMLLLWAGLMVGAPTYCDFRYMFLFALGLPLVFFTALSRAPETTPRPAAPAPGVLEHPMATVESPKA